MSADTAMANRSWFAPDRSWTLDCPVEGCTSLGFADQLAPHIERVHLASADPADVLSAEEISVAQSELLRRRHQGLAPEAAAHLAQAFETLEDSRRLALSEEQLVVHLLGGAR